MSKKLIANLKNGDQSAWESIYQQYKMAFLHVVNKRFHNMPQHIKEEAYNESLLILRSKLLNGELEEIAFNYIVVVGKNYLSNKLKKVSLPQIPLDSIELADGGDNKRDDIQAMILQQGLAKLTGNCQEIMQRYFDYESPEEIAKAMNYEATSASSLISRCKRKLIAIIHEILRHNKI